MDRALAKKARPSRSSSVTDRTPPPKLITMRPLTMAIDVSMSASCAISIEFK